MAGNLLFDMLSKEARRAIFASMEPLVVSAGAQIITQVRCPVACVRKLAYEAMSACGTAQT